MSVLHFVPTTRFLDPENAIDWKLTNHNYYGPSDDLTPITVKHMSDIQGALSDYHVDIGRTLGLTKIVLRARYTLEAGEYRAVYSLTQYNPETLSYDTLIGGFDPDSPTETTNPDAFAGHPLRPAPTNTEYGFEQVFTAEQFLLLNLCFKNPRAGKPSVEEGDDEPPIVDYEFPDEAARTASGAYVEEDVGKFATQTDDGSYWQLIELLADEADADLMVPLWSKDLPPEMKAEMIAGTLVTRPVLFLGVDAVDYDGTYTNGIFKFHAFMLGPDQDVWDNGVTALERPPHPDAKDERIFPGDLGKAWQHPPTGTATYLYTELKAYFRWAVSVMVSNPAASFPPPSGQQEYRIERHLSGTTSEPWFLMYFGDVFGAEAPRPYDWIDRDFHMLPQLSFANMFTFFHWLGGWWDATKTYANGDMLKFGNDIWASAAGGNTNNVPAVGSTWWFKATQAYLNIATSPSSGLDEVLTTSDFFISWVPDGIGGYTTPPPGGADPTTVETHTYSKHRYETRHTEMTLLAL